MTARWCVAWLGVCLIAAAGCRTRDLSAVERSPTAVAREQRLEKVLADRNAGLDGQPIARWVLPASLREISGLVITKSGNLLVQGDEVGEIWQLDYRRGILVKQFFLGDKAQHGDFEGITVVNDTLYMITSSGKIYQFQEGADNAHVPFRVFDTGLKNMCEFEGIAFDPSINSLLLACKHVHEKDVRDAILIFRWSLAGDTTTNRLSKLVVPLGSGVLGPNGWKTLHPSDITVDPVTGNYVLLASLEKAMIEITPAGEVVFVRLLARTHEQAEGIAITKDSILIISDEAKQSPAAITLYKWPLR